MEEKKVVEILNKVFRFSVVGVVGLVPIFFLPITSNYFSFNKGFVFLTLMTIGFTALLLKSALLGNFEFVSTNFDKWVLAFFASGTLALIFAQNFITSFLGFNMRMADGFIVMPFVYLLFVLIRSEENIEKWADVFLGSLAFSSVLVSIVSMLQYFGVYVFKGISGLETSGSRTFSLLGDSAILPVFVLVGLVLSVSFILRYNDNLKVHISSFFAALLNLLCFIAITSVSWNLSSITLWVIGVAGIGFLIYSSQSFKKSKIGLYILGIVGVVFILIVNIPLLMDSFVKTDDPITQAEQVSTDTSWIIATESVTQNAKRAVFGRGHDGFVYAYNLFRPVEVLRTDLWNQKAVNSTNEFFNVAVEYGVLGLITWIVMWTAIAVWVYKLFKKNHRSPYRGYIYTLSIVIGIVFLSTFFLYMNLVIWMVLALSMGMLVLFASISDSSFGEKFSFDFSASRKKMSGQACDLTKWFVIIPSLIFIFTVGSFLFKVYKAEYIYKRAQNEVAAIGDDDDRLEKLDDVYYNLNRARSTFKYRDAYFADTAVIATDLLKIYSEKAAENESKAQAEMQTDGDSETDVESGQNPQTEMADMESVDTYEDERRSLLNDISKNTTRATDLNQYNPRNWEIKYSVYMELANLTGGGRETALTAINNAIAVDPVNPLYYYNKGLLLTKLGYTQESLQAMAQSLNLRPQLIDVRYDLARMYVGLGEKEKAIQQLELILTILDSSGLSESSAFQRVSSDIENLQQQELEDQDTDVDGGEILEDVKLEDSTELNEQNSDGEDGFDLDTDGGSEVEGGEPGVENGIEVDGESGRTE